MIAGAVKKRCSCLSMLILLMFVRFCTIGLIKAFCCRGGSKQQLMAIRDHAQTEKLKDISGKSGRFRMTRKKKGMK